MRASKLTLFVILSLLPLQALAVTPIPTPPPASLNSTDSQSYLYSSEYYWPGQTGLTDDGNTGCASLALPTINDATAFGTAIDNYIRSTTSNSPLIGLGSDFVAAGQQYGVNPAYVVAIAEKESSLGTQIPTGSFNSFGREAGAGQPSVRVNGTSWYKYASWVASTSGQSQFMQQRYLSQGLVTIEQITPTYAPPSQNDTQQYIAQMHQFIGAIVALAGASITCGPSPTGGGAIIQIAQQELARHLIGTGPLQNGGPVCKYEGSACGAQSNWPHSAGEAWCADFVSWVLNQAGTPFTGGADGGWRLAGAAEVEQWFVKNGIWVNNTPTASPPQPGDIFYTAAGEGHVGIIESVSGNSVITIEGNAGPTVASVPYANYHTTGWAGWGRMK